ncbi:MAG TPA: hypothetical protein VEK57_03855 [Thermoanaerobaculia bacterium]|nr:hypothetical protein [Thermoanaerobaculia bacterium]
MIIRFMGLICHMDRRETGDDLAVLMRETGHFPYLRVPNRHRWGAPDDADGTECIDLRNKTIWFNPLGTGIADRTGLVDVPSLSAMGGMGGVLHPNIVSRYAADPADELESFVILPAGVYDIEDWYRNKGTLAAGPPVCVARTVRYTAPATGKITVAGISGPIELKQNAIISITNFERIMIPGNHFGRYGDLFSPRKTIASPLHSPTDLCPQGTEDYAYPKCRDDSDEQHLSVECSNSTYP